MAVLAEDGGGRTGRSDGRMDGPGELARRREIQYEITPSARLPAKSPRGGDLGFTPRGAPFDRLRPPSEKVPVGSEVCLFNYTD